MVTTFAHDKQSHMLHSYTLLFLCGASSGSCPSTSFSVYNALLPVVNQPENSTARLALLTVNQISRQQRTRAPQNSSEFNPGFLDLKISGAHGTQKKQTTTPPAFTPLWRAQPCQTANTKKQFAPRRVASRLLFQPLKPRVGTDKGCSLVARA